MSAVPEQALNTPRLRALGKASTLGWKICFSSNIAILSGIKSVICTFIEIFQLERAYIGTWIVISLRKWRNKAWKGCYMPGPKKKNSLAHPGMSSFSPNTSESSGLAWSQLFLVNTKYSELKEFYFHKCNKDRGDGFGDKGEDVLHVFRSEI